MVLKLWSGKRRLAIVLIACAACEADPEAPLGVGEAPAVRADPPGHTFNGTVRIDLLADPPASIFYTLDGSSPTGPNAKLYTEPFELNDGALVTFVGVTAEGLWSPPRAEFYEQQRALRPTRIAKHALEVSSNALFFEVETESPPMKTVRLRSVGLDWVRIDIIQLAVNPQGAAFFEPGVFELSDPPATPLFLAPGDTIDIRMAYRPTTTLRSAALVIFSNDERQEDGVHVIQLWGRIF